MKYSTHKVKTYDLVHTDCTMKTAAILCFLVVTIFGQIHGYNIVNFESNSNADVYSFVDDKPTDHAKVARQTVHNAGKSKYLIYYYFVFTLSLSKLKYNFTVTNKPRILFSNSDWTAFGTNSATKELHGYPMVNVISVADSKRGDPSTGDIYYYLTNLDYTAQDLMRDNHLTMLFSQEQSLSCSLDNVDPMEPTCARIMISGQAIKVGLFFLFAK